MYYFTQSFIKSHTTPNLELKQFQWYIIRLPLEQHWYISIPFLKLRLTHNDIKISILDIYNVRKLLWIKNLLPWPQSFSLANAGTVKDDTYNITDNRVSDEE